MFVLRDLTRYAITLDSMLWRLYWLPFRVFPIW